MFVKLGCIKDPNIILLLLSESVIVPSAHCCIFHQLSIYTIVAGLVAKLVVIIAVLVPQLTVVIVGFAGSVVLSIIIQVQADTSNFVGSQLILNAHQVNIPVERLLVYFFIDVVQI
jgi:hypothetical protein